MSGAEQPLLVQVPLVPSIFGATLRNYDLSGWAPIHGARAMIVAHDHNRGIRPVRLLLPHQLYQRDVDEAFAEDSTLRRVWVTPWLCVAGDEAGLTHPRNIDTTGGRHGK